MLGHDWNGAFHAHDAAWRVLNSVGSVLDSGEEQLHRLVIDAYNRIAPQGNAGYAELVEIVRVIERHFGMPPASFEALPAIFERFDFDGNGVHSADETVQIIRSCLRWYRNELSPKSAKAVYMQLRHANVEDAYVILKKLGEGGQGAAYLACLRESPDEVRCVKIYSKANANAPLESIKDEFELMQKLSFPYISRMFDIFEDRAHVYLVSDPFFGGDLTTLIARASDAGVSMTERWFCDVFIQPVQGLRYLNHQHIMHCDLKEANIMVASESEWHNPAVVLIDFGLAQNFMMSELGVCGTPNYIPPETWLKQYWVPKGDVFSLGVVFFQLLAGIEGLFSEYVGATDMDDIARCTCMGQPPLRLFDDRPELQTLLARMLEKDVARRCSIGDVATSSWFRQCTDSLISPDVIDSIRQLSTKSKAQLTVAEMMLRQFSARELRHLGKAFLALDADMSGSLSVEEARRGLAQVGLRGVDAERFIASLVGTSGTVSYRSFMAGILCQQGKFETAELWAGFCEIDVNRDGVLNEAEIGRVLRSMNYSEHDAARFFKAADRNRDGRISFEEFKRVALGEDDAAAAFSESTRLARGDAIVPQGAR